MATAVEWIMISSDGDQFLFLKWNNSFTAHRVGKELWVTAGLEEYFLNGYYFYASNYSWIKKSAGNKWLESNFKSHEKIQQRLIIGGNKVTLLYCIVKYQSILLKWAAELVTIVLIFRFR